VHEAQGRERLERALVRLSLAGAGARAAQPPRGRRRPAKAEQPATPATAQVAAPAPEPAPPADSEPPESLLIELPQLDDLVERLDRLESKLDDLQRPPRPLPATRDVFSEWVRLRRWEEMPFGEFLKLRRAGRI
jgi:hypothetical protein